MKNIIRFISKNRAILVVLIAALMLLVFNEEVFARLGGSGGSRNSSSGGGDGIIGILFMLWYILPFPLNLIAIVLVGVGYFFYKKKQKQKSVLNKLPNPENTKSAKIKGMEEFKAANANFDEAAFMKKVKQSFEELQYAWAEQDMSKVRKYISDGMYQRLNTQFKMMQLLEQRNTIEHLNVRNVQIDKVESDGSFDIIHVAIYASVKDKFISDKYKELKSGGKEHFVEYWSYIRKKGIEEKDLYSTNKCPNCGSDLPENATESSKCEYCGTLTNSGDYDWVLAEITQADDYISENPGVSKDSNLSKQVRKLVADNEDFAVQFIEDKASNGYLQIETAKVLKESSMLRRFVNDKTFEKVSKQIEAEQSYVYNRLFLNDVTLIGAMQKDKQNHLMVAVKVSYQRVVPEGDKVSIIDPVVVTKTDVVVVSRALDATPPKGSLYMHNCPACGAPCTDSLNTSCEYCSEQMNLPNHEWIISDLMSLSEYHSFYSANASSFAVKIDPNKVDGLYKIRDYAFNNLLILVASDGHFAEQEKEFTQKMAKKWGYKVEKIQPMFDMAHNNQLVLRMPEGEKEQTKIYKMMEKAANVDGSVSPHEQALLDNIKTQYKISY